MSIQNIKMVIFCHPQPSNDGEYSTITSYIISNPTGEVVSVDYFFS